MAGSSFTDLTAPAAHTVTLSTAAATVRSILPCLCRPRRHTLAMESRRARFVHLREIDMGKGDNSQKNDKKNKKPKQDKKK